MTPPSPTPSGTLRRPLADRPESWPVVSSTDLHRDGWVVALRSDDKGNPVEWILAAGADFDVDLIVMTTEGHTSLFDLLRGSTTERVVRGARCPLLAIPA